MAEHIEHGEAEGKALFTLRREPDTGRVWLVTHEAVPQMVDLGDAAPAMAVMANFLAENDFGE